MIKTVAKTILLCLAFAAFGIRTATAAQSAASSECVGFAFISLSGAIATGRIVAVAAGEHHRRRRGSS